jgi:hypothetical protein
MDQILLAILAITVTHVLVVIPLVDNWVMAQAQNTTTPENTTLPQKSTQKSIIRDNILTVVNTTTNETIMVRNLTENAGNTTTNESLATNAGNATTNESLATNAGNATTNVNLTAKFKALQGK